MTEKMEGLDIATARRLLEFRGVGALRWCVCVGARSRPLYLHDLHVCCNRETRTLEAHIRAMRYRHVTFCIIKAAVHAGKGTAFDQDLHRVCRPLTLLLS